MPVATNKAGKPQQVGRQAMCTIKRPPPAAGCSLLLPALLPPALHGSPPSPPASLRKLRVLLAQAEDELHGGHWLQVGKRAEQGRAGALRLAWGRQAR